MKSTELFKGRRSRYVLTDKLPITDQELEKLIGEVLWQMPSSFNMQSARVVLLLGTKHHALWQIAHDALKAIVPADKFEPTEQKIKSFSAAYGTILYLEDEETIARMQQTFPVYADNFPTWAQQANGMLQFALWTALAEAGIGASLQHYNPLIDEAAKAKFVQQKAEIEASTAIIKAKGEAEAIRIRGKALEQNPQLIQLQLVEKWNGIAPLVVAPGGGNGGGANIILPLGSVKQR